MQTLPLLPVLALLASSPPHGEWSRFRGPDGTGVAADTAAYPARLALDENLLWRANVAPGHSSPCLAGTGVFLTGAEEGRLVTYGLDRASGEVRWTRAVQATPEARLHEINSPAASTPASDGERVFVQFGGYGLLAYDLDGELLWEHPAPPPDNTFGSAASPILAAGRLVVVRDTNTESWIEALDPATGELLWRQAREGFQSGWSTPVPWTHDGVLELLVYGAGWLSAYDLADGRVRWSVPGLTDEPIITPACGEGLVFVSSYNMKSSPEVIGLPEFDAVLAQYDTDKSGDLDRQEVEPNRSVLSRFDDDGEGDHPLRIFFRFLDVDKNGAITREEWKKLVGWVDSFSHANGLIAIRPGGPEHAAEVVWSYPRGTPEVPSPLYHDGRLFAVSNGGLVTCLAAADGALLYQGRLDARGPYYASPVAGGGHLYTASARGSVSVLAEGATLRPLASLELGERLMATPALQDGRVYVRTESAVYAFGPRD